MSTDTVAKLLQTPEGRRALSVKSPVFFDTYYCGMRHAPHRENWLERFEKARLKAKDSNQEGHLLILAPRDHGKTEACISYALRAICLDRNTRILWICESAGQAEKRMRRVKTLLDSARIKEDWTTAPEQGFGPFRVTDEDKWTSMQVYVNRPLQSVDPTLEAVGSGGAVTGGHFDVILADDVEDDRTTFSATVRAKTRDWFKGTLGPMLVRNGVQIVVGTRKHHDDLYAHLLEDPTFEVMEDKAVEKWPESYSYQYEEDDKGRKMVTGVRIDGDHQVLWEAERPLDYLLRKRLTVGQRLFSREFQNEVQDDSAAAIKWEWLAAAKKTGARLKLWEHPGIEGLDVVQGWDLALVTDARSAETRDTDYTVGVTWARDDHGNRYLLGIRRIRGTTPAQLRGHVVAEYDRFDALGLRPRTVAVEKNNFGELHFLGLQRTTDLPLKPHLTTGKNKADPWDGVPSLSALFENGKVVLPCRDQDSREAIEPLVQELWGLGRERHDDTVMALWIAETVLRKSSFVHRVSFGDGPDMAAEADERLAPADLLDEDTESSVSLPEEQRKRGAPEVWRGLPWYVE